LIITDATTATEHADAGQAPLHAYLDDFLRAEPEIT